MDTRYAVYHLPGPAWLAGKSPFEQPGMRAHVDHYRPWLAAGRLELGGPHPDGTGGGLMVTVPGLTFDEVERFAQADPAVASGLLRAQVRPWLIGMDRRPLPRDVLLVVDMQCGAFDGSVGTPIDDGDALLDRVRSLVSAARAAGVPVVFVQHDEAPGSGGFETGSAAWQLHPQVQPADGEPVVHKATPNGFDGTSLHETLQALGATRLVLCGLQSELCVSHTARGALAQGYDVCVVADAHGTWPADGRRAADIAGASNTALATDGAQLLGTAAVARLWAGAGTS